MKHGWEDKATIDPGIAALTVRARLLNASRWQYPFIIRAQRRRAILRALWELVGWVLFGGLVVLAMYLVGA